MDKIISYQEIAKIKQKQLSEQGPITLGYARAQVLWLKFKSKTNKHKEEDIKNHLAMYYPEWTKEKIDREYDHLFDLVMNQQMQVVYFATMFKNIM